MATKDISDLQVVQAYAAMQEQMASCRDTEGKFEYPDEILERITGEHPRVCESAMSRAYRRDLVDFGMWLRGGWLTEKGLALLASNKGAQPETLTRHKE